MCWILIVLLATRILIGLRRPAGIFSKYLILPLFFLLGGAHTAPFLSPPEDSHHIYNLVLAPTDAVVTGTLLEAPEVRDDKSRLLLETDQLFLEDQDFQGSGRILLTMPGHPPNEINPGDRIIVKTRLNRPRSFGVPGAFDYASFLAKEKIWITGWISSPYLVREIQEIPQPFLKKIRSAPESIRQKIGIFIDKVLPPETAGIYKAILTGDRSGIPPEITENYKAAGNIHLLAISGLHVGLLTFFLTSMIVWCLKRSETILLKWSVWKSAAVISAAPLGLYALIAGFNAPVFRALVMTYIFMGALIWDRRQSILNSLAIAALILLTINPSSLFTVSFQLSFAAVGSIALIFPKISSLFHGSGAAPNQEHQTKKERSYLDKIKAFCLASVLISIAASLGTAPLLAYHFNRVSLLSPASTILTEPLLCFWSLISGLIACLFLPLPFIAKELFQIGAWGITASNSITSMLAGLPFSFIWVPTPSLSAIIAYLSVLTFILFVFAQNGPVTHQAKTIKYLKFAFPLTAAAFALMLFLETGQKPKNQGSTVSVLDVGHGLAVVVELPNKKVFIIDGGKKLAGNSSRFDVGRDLIAPFLWKKGVRKITGIIISHSDSDHSNGLPFLMEHFQPEVVWTNSTAKNTKELARIHDLSLSLSIPVKTPKADELIYSAKQISLQTIGSLHMDDDRLEAGGRVKAKNGDDNNRSLIVKLTVNNTAFLFPGDIEEKAERNLIENGTDLDADILVAPHHGSKTSNSDDFISSVSPDYVVVSAGAEKWGTFPSLEVLQKYIHSGSTVMATGISGSIFFRMNDELEIESFY